jgi:hypothetical protein
VDSQVFPQGGNASRYRCGITNQTEVCDHSHRGAWVFIAAAGQYNRAVERRPLADLVNEQERLKLSPDDPQGFVDKLCMTCPVGRLQRQEIKQRRGLQRGSFDYNEIPTSSCHTFCWKARH